MTKSVKIFTYILGVVFVLLVMIFLSVQPVLNSARVKSEIESILDEEFDMNFKIVGVIDIDFSAEITVVIHDVRVSIPTGQIASADKIVIDPGLLDLLFLSVRLQKVVIHEPALIFDQLAVDKIMAWVEEETPEIKPVESFSIESFAISDAKFQYADDELLIDLIDIDVTGGSLSFIADRRTVVDDVASFLKGIHFRGDFSATEISSPDFKLDNIRATVSDQYGVITADPVELNYLDSLTKLYARLDLNQAKPDLKLHVSTSELNLLSYAKRFYPQITAKGKLSIDAGFSATDIELDQLLETSDKTPQPGRTADSDIVPVKSITVESLKISGKNLSFSGTGTALDITHLALTTRPLSVIQNNRLVLTDADGLLKASIFKGRSTISRLSAKDQEFENIQANLSGERGLIKSEPLALTYKGYRTKLTGTLDLTPELPDLKLHVELYGSDVKPLVERALPDFDVKGNLNLRADIHAVGIQMDNLVESFQAISESDQPLENQDLPVKNVTITSFLAATKNLGLARDNFILHDADLDLSSAQMSVIEKNRITIKDIKTLLMRAKFDAQARINKISILTEKFTDIKFTIHGDQGIIKSDSIELDYFEGRTKIAGFFSMQDNLNHLKAQIEIVEFNLEKSYQESWEVDLARGKLNMHAEFEARAAFMRDILKKVNGYFSIRGRDIVVKGVDLDKALDQFKKISRYGFNDFSALLLLGPLGAVVSHGYDQLAAIEKLMAARGDSAIKQIISDWNVVDGVATAKDVAFSTQRHRVAVKGGLDLPNKKYNKMTIAVVDPEGCIKNGETVNGPFENPEVKDVGVLNRLLVRPLKKFLQTKCDFFYDGALPHPAGQ